MPKPEHVPTQQTRELVKVHTMVGTPQDILCKMLGITSKTMRKHYRDELDFATAQANAAIGGALFNKAKGGDTTAQIFWMKTRAGFRETNNHNHLSEDGSMRPTTIIIEGGE